MKSYLCFLLCYGGCETAGGEEIQSVFVHAWSGYGFKKNGIKKL